MKSSILIVDCGSSKVVQIEQVLGELNIDYETIAMDDLNEELALEYKGIIISGKPSLISNEDPTPLIWKFNFLIHYPNPVLGICFGHQILGMVHGAQIKLGKEKRDWEEIEIIESSTLFNYIRKPFDMIEDHTEEIILPEGFKLLAQSKSCSVEAMQHKIKPLFGVQFHPESSDRKGMQLLKNFCKICF